MSDSFHIAPWAPCQHCNDPNEIAESSFPRFFTQASLPCTKCGKPFDLWETVLNWVGQRFSFSSALTLAGAQSTMLRAQLKSNAVVEIDLRKAGLPDDAEILSLNLTSGGGSAPLLVHGNEVLREPLRPRFFVFGQELPSIPSGATADCPLYVSAVWFVRRNDDTVFRHLIDAARQYEAARFDAVVVPANIAAEAAITPVVAAALANYGTADARKNFLQDAATYSHQLNLLLDLVADLHSAARLPEQIRIGLNRLRKLRNKVGHEGRCDEQTRADAAGHLCAAIFGVEYAKFLGGHLPGQLAQT